MTKPRITPQMEEMLLRSRFCAAVAEEVPEVLGDLGRLSGEELNVWAQRWHLDVPWIIERAKRTAEYSERYPNLPLSAIWMTPGGVADYHPQAVEFVIRWDPSRPGGQIKTTHHEPEKVSKRNDEEPPDSVHEKRRPERIEVTVGGGRREAAWCDARKAWTEYAEMVEAQFREAGFATGTQRTGGKNTPIDERMRWVVWRVVRGMTWGQIGEAAGVHRSTARAAVVKLTESPALELPAV